MIDRWIMDSDYRRPDPKGMWVRYKDHVDAIERLQAELDDAAEGATAAGAIIKARDAIERLQAEVVLPGKEDHA